MANNSDQLEAKSVLNSANETSSSAMQPEPKKRRTILNDPDAIGLEPIAPRPKTLGPKKK